MLAVRCRICGETYLGSAVPVACPYCGAHEGYLVTDGSYDDAVNAVAPTEVERADLERASEIERANARFYAALASLPGNSVLASAYKRLARIEAEHCSVFCKLLREPKPDDMAVPSEAPADWREAIAESRAREEYASAFYAEAASNATNPRVWEIFSAIAEVEADHIAFDDVALGMIDG